ncbi:protoporphyrinogen oxidase [Fodinisporobacter ferrooxydans]|uniref:Coproporphyrinogen III oxidase n=1 Tax=Fodinisporobacter ferrooxydans TaxID=2901836 RepID=A0ABY4CR83_9BACL|nr:protoporphyrinogen oxidase [Alicyclobacillaceae bacterium MYW30-H2]
MTNKPIRVLIIGGGISGLSAAHYIVQKAKQNGISVACQVIEKDERLGGKIQTERYNGFVMEGGPDSFLARKKAAPNLCRELGLADELVGTNPQARQNFILHNGKLHLMPPGTMMGIPAEIGPFVRTSLISPIGKLRAAFDLVLPKGETQQDESLGLFLRRRLGDELLENLVEPLLAGIYAGDANLLSLQATFPQFQELEAKHRSLILGIMNQRKSSPKPLNSTSVPSSGAVPRLPNSMFLSLRTGLIRLIERLTDVLTAENVQIHANQGVQTIEPPKSPNGMYTVQLENGKSVSAHVVFVTTPAIQTQKMFEPFISLPQLQEIPYVSVSTVLLAYPKHLLQHSLNGSGFVVPRKEKRMITACTWVSSKWSHTAPDDFALLRCYVGRSGDERFLSLTDEELVSRVQKDLQDIMGITATPSLTRVVRWNQAMPQYLVGHLTRMKQLQETISESLPGVFLSGAGYYGLGIPDCIQQSLDAAEKAIDYIQKQLGAYTVSG